MNGKNTILLLGFLLALSAHVPENNCVAQGYTPSELQQSEGPSATIEPEYQYSRNIAIRRQISTTGYCAGFDAFESDSMIILVIPEGHKFRFWDVTDIDSPIMLGSIASGSTNDIARDAEVVSYGDSCRLFLCFVNEYDPEETWEASEIIDVPFYEQSIDSAICLAGDNKSYSQILDAGAESIEPGPEIRNIEMIYHHDGMLFVATNTQDLVYYDVSLASKATESEIALSPPGSGTEYTDEDYIKNHEVKGWTLSNGYRIIGIGNVRTGMNILLFDEDWVYQSTTVQVYDFDRTLHPDTLINPHKAVYDSVFYYDTANDTYLTDIRNNKWDHSICHSVIPYEHDGEVYVLTVDEYTNFDGVQDLDTVWVKEYWEHLDFFRPKQDTTLSSNNPVYYKGERLPRDKNFLGPTEASYCRLNFLHRNHPTYPNVDPNRLQGAFLRIWNYDALGDNDTSANAKADTMLLNAYDVDEGSGAQAGSIGVSNIPKLSSVPVGLHEPYLHRNTLYLGGYNAGTRILSLHGSDLKVRAYCRTESYLSLDTNDVNFYGRPDIIMYAKGIYRLTPDTSRPGIVYGSDMYNGIWVMQYFDSTLADIIRHIPFQERVRIGTIDPTQRRLFRVAEGGVVIGDSAIVELVDNTDLAWYDRDSITVNGELHIGSVYFDSTYYYPARNKIFCAAGGKCIWVEAERRSAAD